MTLAKPRDVAQGLSRDLSAAEGVLAQEVLNYIEALIHVKEPNVIAQALRDDDAAAEVAAFEVKVCCDTLRAPSLGLYLGEDPTLAVNTMLSAHVLTIQDSDLKGMAGRAFGQKESRVYIPDYRNPEYLSV